MLCDGHCYVFVPGDAYKSVMHSYSNKQVNVERFKSQLVQMEKDITSKTSEIETSTNKLNVSMFLELTGQTHNFRIHWVNI